MGQVNRFQGWRRLLAAGRLVGWLAGGGALSSEASAESGVGFVVRGADRQLVVGRSWLLVLCMSFAACRLAKEKKRKTSKRWRTERE